MSDNHRIISSIRCTPLEISLADDLAAARDCTRHSILVEACTIGLRAMAADHGLEPPPDTPAPRKKEKAGPMLNALRARPQTLSELKQISEYPHFLMYKARKLGFAITYDRSTKPPVYRLVAEPEQQQPADDPGVKE